MRARFAADVEAFRDEVRAFLEDAMEPERANAHADARDLTGLDEEFERTLQQAAAARGYLAVSVPAGFGGGGRSSAFRAAFGLEAAAFDAPIIDTALTLGGAPILAFGSEEQRAALVPAMVRGEILLCIAYTEADAGSDLANITTNAARTTDGWVINGTKVLVTGAHKSDWCLLVARTDPEVPPRKAMTMFLVELGTPGITIRRVPTANGWTLSDIEFVDVHVPASAVLGEPGRGFAQMAAALADERSGFFWVGWAEQRLADLLAAAACTPDICPMQRDTLARLWIDVAIARQLAMRVIADQDQGLDTTVAAASSKVFVTELLQRIASAGVAQLGPSGLLTGPLFGPTEPNAPFRGRFAYECVERLHPTISVGSNEIQRDVIAHRGLGLPVT